jgi:hypothetical protein
LTQAGLCAVQAIDVLGMVPAEVDDGTSPFSAYFIKQRLASKWEASFCLDLN